MKKDIYELISGEVLDSANRISTFLCCRIMDTVYTEWLFPFARLSSFDSSELKHGVIDFCEEKLDVEKSKD